MRSRGWIKDFPLQVINHNLSFSLYFLSKGNLLKQPKVLKTNHKVMIKLFKNGKQMKQQSSGFLLLLAITPSCFI